MSKTLRDFVGVLRQSQVSQMQFWLSILEERSEQWQETLEWPLEADSIVVLADGFATLLAERLLGICTEQLYERTRREGHAILEEIHRLAAEQGIDININRIDRLLTYTEAAEAAGIVKVENGMVSLTKQGEMTAQAFWGNRLKPLSSEGLQLECPACGIVIDALAVSDDGTSRCPHCGCLARTGLIIRITEIPKGTAPKKVREAWVGIELIAEIHEGAEHDLITGQDIQLQRGRFYAVPKDFALEALKSKAPEAAKWFCENMLSMQGGFTFGMDEAELVGKLTVFDVL